MEILQRPIAITDVETTGLDPTVHEIIEIGLIVVNQQALEIIDRYDEKIKPEHLEYANKRSLEINGYNEADWQDAVTLQQAMTHYEKKTREAIFASHNVTFDWSFIDAAFRKTGIENKMDYHRIDLFTMAWLELRNSGIEKFNMNEVAKFLGIGEEPRPHRAMNGAMTAYEIYKRLI